MKIQIAIASEEEQYAYYEGKAGSHSSVDTDLVKNYNGSAKNWWLRSPYNSDRRNFCGVYLRGSSTTDTASNTYGVAPGFSI